MSKSWQASELARQIMGTQNSQEKTYATNLFSPRDNKNLNQFYMQMSASFHT